jgi:hypothetical protein
VIVRAFFSNENAVNIQIGYLMNLIVLLIITGSITSAFYLYTDASSEQVMRVSYTDLGSQIARDITNMYLISQNSQENLSLNVTRNIPLTMGGKGYRIELINSTENSMASIDISEGSFSAYKISTTLNSIKNIGNTGGVVYSGSGEINIRLKKNHSGMVSLRIG